MVKSRKEDMQNQSDSSGTARTVAFRCPADLEAALTKEASDLGVSVSRAIDGLLRQGIDTRSQKQREERIEQSLTEVISRLEFLTERTAGRNQFEDEATVLGFAIVGFERGDREVLGLLGNDAFVEPIHRRAWGAMHLLDALRGGLPRGQKLDTVPNMVAEAFGEEPEATEIVQMFGSLKAYFERLADHARSAEPNWKNRVADAARGVLAAALVKLVNGGAPNADFAASRTRALAMLAQGRGDQRKQDTVHVAAYAIKRKSGTVHVAARAKKRQNRKAKS